MMKRIYTIAIAIFLTTNVFAQSPEKMNYQGVIRDAKNTLVTNQTIGMRISIEANSGNGVTVYSETQNPTTNSNGLVSIEVGDGNVIEGDFSTIDWSEGQYFIKTEIDPNGGTNYTITGTSQLLSVPYALYANLADSIAGGVTETDPEYRNSEAVNITTIDIDNLSNLSGINTGDQDLSNLATKIALGDSIVQVRNEIPKIADGSETKVTAGNNITVTGSGTSNSPYVVNATGDTPLAIGDSYQGGIIFWLDETGQHGLIAATTDQSEGIKIPWSVDSSLTNAVRDGIGAGMFNTERIIVHQGTGTYAAQLCANYRGGEYGDWYLPSIYELDLMYFQRGLIGGFSADAAYWSSTESIDNYLLVGTQYFGNDNHVYGYAGKINGGAFVRAIRAF